jgi:hypothetical protein
MIRIFMKKQLPVKRKEELPDVNRTYTPDDVALVHKYFKKKETEPARFKVDKKINNGVYISPDEESDIAFHCAKMLRAFGTVSIDLQQHFQNQLVSVFKGCSPNAHEEKIVSVLNMAIAILNEIQPRDIIESMLVVQMIGVHNMAMTTLGNAMLTDTQAGREVNVCQATKMLRTFTQQMDTLKNYRQKGQQKVTVEHVNVNNGGQAIVGSVTKRGEE